MAQTVKSDQERADELANNIKITKDVVTVSGAMMYTDVRSARMLHEIGGELIDASDEMRDATNKIAQGLKDIAQAMVDAEVEVRKLFNQGYK